MGWQVVEHEIEFALSELVAEDVYKPLVWQDIKAPMSGKMKLIGLCFATKLSEKKNKLLPCCLKALLDEKTLPGLGVDKVLPKSDAAKCGVTTDWRLMTVNEYRIDTIADLNKVMKRAHDAQAKAKEHAESLATSPAVQAPAMVVEPAWLRKLKLRFVVYQKHPIKGTIPMTVQIADERWQEALIYIAPKFPYWMRRFLSYAPKMPDGTRRHFTFDPKDDRKVGELATFYHNIGKSNNDDGDAVTVVADNVEQTKAKQDNIGNSNNDDGNAATVVADNVQQAKAEQEMNDFKKSWRVTSITKTDAYGRKATSAPLIKTPVFKKVCKPRATNENAKEASFEWVVDPEQDLRNLGTFATKVLIPKNETRLQKRLCLTSETSKTAMGEDGANNEEVTIEFEQALVCIALNPNTVRRIRFNLLVEAKNKAFNMYSDVGVRHHSDDDDSDDDEAPKGNSRNIGDMKEDEATKKNAEAEAVAKKKEKAEAVAKKKEEAERTKNEAARGKKHEAAKKKAKKGSKPPPTPPGYVSCFGLALESIQGTREPANEMAPDTGAALVRSKSRRASSLGEGEFCVIVKSVASGTQASRLDVRSEWTVDEVSLVDTGVERSKWARLYRNGQVLARAEHGAFVEAESSPPLGPEKNQVQFNHLQELEKELTGKKYEEVEFGFVLPKGMVFAEDKSIKGWEVTGVGRGSEADFKGIKQHWVLVSIEGIRVDRLDEGDDKGDEGSLNDLWKYLEKEWKYLEKEAEGMLTKAVDKLSEATKAYEAEKRVRDAKSAVATAEVKNTQNESSTTRDATGAAKSIAATVEPEDMSNEDTGTPDETAVAENTSNEDAGTIPDENADANNTSNEDVGMLVVDLDAKNTSNEHVGTPDKCPDATNTSNEHAGTPDEGPGVRNTSNEDAGTSDENVGKLAEVKKAAQLAVDAASFALAEVKQSALDVKERKRDAAAGKRNAMWARLIESAKATNNDLDLVFQMPKYVPKLRSLTGGVFGESDPLNLENSILSAKQRDRALTFGEWKDTSYRLLKVGRYSRDMSQGTIASLNDESNRSSCCSSCGSTSRDDMTRRSTTTSCSKRCSTRLTLNTRRTSTDTRPSCRLSSR